MRKFTLIIIVCLLSVLLSAAQDRSGGLVSRTDDTAVDCLQYLPVVFPEIMKACGQPTRSDWGRMAVSQSFSVVLMAGSVYTIKHFVNSRRPDRSDYNSFLSGHTAWAFVGATAVAKELGWRSPWYPVGAYAFATGIAVERIVARRHSAIDVAAGAVIGVAMGELGYFLADKIYGSRGLDADYRLSVSPSAFIVDPLPQQGRNLVTAGLSPGVIVRLEF